MEKTSFASDQTWASSMLSPAPGMQTHLRTGEQLLGTGNTRARYISPFLALSAPPPNEKFPGEPETGPENQPHSAPSPPAIASPPAVGLSDSLSELNLGPSSILGSSLRGYSGLGGGGNGLMMHLGDPDGQGLGAPALILSDTVRHLTKLVVLRVHDPES